MTQDKSQDFPGNCCGMSCSPEEDMLKIFWSPFSLLPSTTNGPTFPIIPKKYQPHGPLSVRLWEQKHYYCILLVPTKKYRFSPVSSSIMDDSKCQCSVRDVLYPICNKACSKGVEVRVVDGDVAGEEFASHHRPAINIHDLSLTLTSVVWP